LGAFKTSYGLEPICSIAVPIPILTDKIFNDIVKSDRDVKLTILSLVGREKVGEITYADVWDNNFVMKFNSEACSKGYKCKVIDNCPTNAFIITDGLISAIDRYKCFNCGNCVRLCPDAFSMNLKSIQYEGSEIPVVLRQSDRAGAIMLADELKQQILKEEFQLKKPTGRLDFAEKLK
jgi:NAD-dependent dihydropyrimidine dehydrogenase PreA subunit